MTVSMHAWLELCCKQRSGHRNIVLRQYSCTCRESGTASCASIDLQTTVVVLCAGRLEAELLSVTKRATSVAAMLPRNVTPVNLEVLRRLKLALVELESKAASLRWVCTHHLLACEHSGSDGTRS